MNDPNDSSLLIFCIGIIAAIVGFAFGWFLKRVDCMEDRIELERLRRDLYE